MTITLYHHPFTRAALRRHHKGRTPEYLALNLRWSLFAPSVIEPGAWRPTLQRAEARNMAIATEHGLG